nr:hypothetical protein CFP56_09075 [Quercus suber]
MHSRGNFVGTDWCGNAIACKEAEDKGRSASITLHTYCSSSSSPPTVGAGSGVLSFGSSLEHIYQSPGILADSACDMPYRG